MLIVEAILTYGVLFMDWGRENTPFRDVSVPPLVSLNINLNLSQIRKWFNEKKESIWAVGQPTRPNLGPSSTVSPAASTLQAHNPR